MLKPIRQSLALCTERSKVRITSAKSEMAKAEETAMSGLKVRRASDDRVVGQKLVPYKLRWMTRVDT